jgi:aquaporin Z
MAPSRSEVRPLIVRLAAEATGTFVLVFGVIGTAVFGGDVGGVKVGYVWIALALGLSVLIGAAALGRVSGGHFNPAVTVGMALAGRFRWGDVAAYLMAQVLGGVIASSLLVVIAAGGPGVTDPAGTVGAVSTGWGGLSPSGYDVVSVFLVEVVATGVFVGVILGVTSPDAPSALAPVAIGLALATVALVAIPVSNGSFNPARSIATAVYGGPEALGQLWVSILAPLLGAVLAGLAARALASKLRSAATTP